MKLAAALRSFALALFRRSRVEREMDEELCAHIAHRAEDLVRSGLQRPEAERRARIEFGGYQKYKEEIRESLGAHFIETLLQDIRYALRMLRKSPGFTAVAVLTLALGIGANTAIFSIVDAVLLRSLPFQNAGRLVDLTEYRPRAVSEAGVSFPDYLAWRQQNTVFDETAAYFLVSASNDIVLGGPSSTERARYSTVTNSFFTILGEQPAIGHGFSANDEIPGGRKVFLISDTLWQTMFGGDPHAIGKAYVLDGEDFTLIGVMPPGFDFPKGCGIWVPTSTLGARGINDRISHPYHVLGRLRQGVTLQQARTQIDAIQKRLAKAYPATDADWRARAQPLLNEIVGNVQTSLFVLLGAVCFILLIACANVVNLMLARASAREKEFAVRATLGAARTRLLRQNLTESFLIVFISVVLAIAFAKWGLALVVSLTSIYLPRMQAFHLRATVLAFLCGVAALTTILVGLVPALRLSRQGPQGVLRDVQYGGSGLRGQRLRGSLVVSEVALALLLLCGAGLMLRSFVQLNRVNPGFRPERLLTFKIALPGAEYPRSEQSKAFFDSLLERLESIPGVRDAAAITFLPLSGQSDWGQFEIEERPALDWVHAPVIQGGGGVSISYFRTLGIPLLRGREFTAADAKNQNTIIINESAAKEFWPGTNPLGQHIISAYNRTHPREIIGIVADVKSAGLDTQDKPEMYAPYGGAWYMNFVLRTNQNPSGIISAVRAQVAALDKGVPVYQVATMDQLLCRSVAPQRFDAFLLGLFALLALGLAAVGIYGVLSFGVAQRTHEIGVRMALGAHPSDILRLIILRGMKLVFAGLILGLAASIALTRFLSALLFDVSAMDPFTFAAVSVLLALIALLACYIPARRAMKVDPMVALRYE
jgi:putative ABC transport system permease protein